MPRPGRAVAQPLLHPPLLRPPVPVSGVALFAAVAAADAAAAAVLAATSAFLLVRAAPPLRPGSLCSCLRRRRR